MPTTKRRARRTTTLSAVQVAAIREAKASDGVALCQHEDCPHPVVADGAWAPGEPHDECALHRQWRRNEQGLCPNCGHAMATVPIINDLTGKPRTHGTTHKRACTSCGYTQRPRLKRGQALRP